MFIRANSRYVPDRELLRRILEAISRLARTNVAILETPHDQAALVGWLHGSRKATISFFGGIVVELG